MGQETKPQDYDLVSTYRFGVTHERFRLRGRLRRLPHLDGVVTAAGRYPLIVHRESGDSSEMSGKRATCTHRAVGLVAHRGVDLPQPDLKAEEVYFYGFSEEWEGKNKANWRRNRIFLSMDACRIPKAGSERRSAFLGFVREFWSQLTVRIASRGLDVARLSMPRERTPPVRKLNLALIAHSEADPT